MEDAIERDDLIDRASAAESNQYRGCTPEQKEKYRNIVRHWNVPKTKTFLYPRDVKEDENDAMEELRQCDSIFLVAPLAEKQGQGRNLLLPELPYIWLRVDSRFDSDPLLSQQDVDEGEDQAEEGGSLVDGQDHSNGTIADTEDNDDNVDGLEEQTGKTDEAEALPKHAMNNGEDGGIKMSVIDVIQSVIKARYPTQDLDWLDDHPPSQPSDFTLDGHGDEPPLQEDTTFSPWKDWTMPPPDSLEVYTMTDHSQTHFAARVRYNNRFLLGERLHVRVVPVNVERMTNLKLGEAGLFREYQIMKTTQERNPDAFRVYGIFGYKHLVDANIACPDTGGSCYRLATTSRADREVVPIRYYAILTTPIGDAIDDTHEQLTIKQIQAFTNTLLDGHTEGYLHGDMNHSGQNLRILADGSTLIIGWRDGTKHDADDNTFKEGKHRELQKFGAYLTKRAAKINEAVPQSNQVKKNSKRKAKPEDRVSQDRELKKLVLLSTGDAEPEGSGLIRED
ncbi:hypothetical protein BDN72DRAFT_896144 [Pluteus cervinus]|uniref:Uncharacterized protein n=1 Tax=Pluteus cervinus TaxID=181527 RepID=A0ACD3AYQ4_9AGAR|nr:hypothetical protein BDN72DRAFT_896144 [Pluteus cervinus]